MGSSAHYWTAYHMSQKWEQEVVSQTQQFVLTGWKRRWETKEECCHGWRHPQLVHFFQRVNHLLTGPAHVAPQVGTGLKFNDARCRGSVDLRALTTLPTRRPCAARTSFVGGVCRAVVSWGPGLPQRRGSLWRALHFHISLSADRKAQPAVLFSAI